MTGPLFSTEPMQLLPATADTPTVLSDLYGEPGWMREARQEAWARYAALPMPLSTEEAWRRTPIAHYPWDSLSVGVSPIHLSGLNELPICWHANLAPEDQVSGTLVHCNGARSYHAMRRDDQVHGVVFDGLHEALDTYDEIIRRYWMRGSAVRPDHDKFTALHAALWRGGTFVYVPAGVRVQRPLQSLVSYDGAAGSSLHHTLVIAEAGSHVTLIQDRVSQETQPALNVEVVEIYAEKGAWVRYVSLHHWGNQRYSITVQDAQLRENANVVWVNGALGSRMTKDFLRSTLVEPGARAQMQGFTFAADTQHIDQSTYQHHQAPNTYSDLLFRNVLRDAATTVFYGMVRAEPEAVDMEGYQANHNLLLGDEGTSKARAHAIPGLEIKCNAVRCSHGATLARLDDEQLFYLQARGLPKAEAARLIVQGAIHPIIERVPLAHLRERLDDEITERFWTRYALPEG
ncbi:MAG TPA: Fe-S cluster assembly protein SufD [Anaerolineae bacterium]|nr:Fe-S cluster assembly protein SufD [Anaerolineae bacterium]